MPDFGLFGLVLKGCNVSTASTNDCNTCCAYACSGPGYLLVRRLQSLLGVAFGLYIFVHLTVNATIVQGGEVFAKQVEKIHSLPFLQAIEWGTLFLPFLFHAGYGTWMLVTCKSNVSHYTYRRNSFYLLQRVTAVAIVLFVFFHVLALKYGAFGVNFAFDAEQNQVGTVSRHLHMGSWVVVVYLLGILVTAFHTANGFANAAITWGATISKASQTRFGFLCVGAFVALLGLGYTALFAALKATPADLVASLLHGTALN